MLHCPVVLVEADNDTALCLQVFQWSKGGSLPIWQPMVCLAFQGDPQYNPYALPSRANEYFVLPAQHGATA